MGDVTPMRRGKAKPAAEEIEELDLGDLGDLEDLDLEDVDLEDEPEIAAPAKKTPAKPKAAAKPKSKPAPKVEEPEEEVELDFEEEEPVEEAPKLREVAKKTRTYTRKTAHDVVEEGTNMTAFLRGYAAGKYGVDLSEEDAARVDATLNAAEQDHTGNLFAYLIGSSTTETASATVIKSPGVTQVVSKAKPATKAQVRAAKPAPAKTAKAAAPKVAAKPASAGKAEVGSMEHKRAWLRKNGYPNLGDRGRLPGEGVAAYEDAHGLA